MRVRVCMCCGEAITEAEDRLHGDPNVCSACLNLAEDLSTDYPTEPASTDTTAQPDKQGAKERAPGLDPTATFARKRAA